MIMATSAALTLLPPSTSLPPLKRLSTYSPALLALSVRALAQLYHPASTASAPSKFVDSGYSSAPNPVGRTPAFASSPASAASSTSDASSSSRRTAVDEAAEEQSELEREWERLRADAFERDYAMRWLLLLISRGEEWVAEGSGEEDGEEQELLREDKERLLEDAAALLAACSRTSEAGTLRREYAFPVGSGGESVHITTRDETYSGDDHTAVGVQTWASSTILAELFAQCPAAYGLPFGPSPSAAALAQEKQYSPARPCRILELGAGTGVLSLLLAALATAHNPRRVHTEIVASDYHPAVLANLGANLMSNFPTQPPWVTLACDRLDWSAFVSPHSDSDSDSDCGAELEAPFTGKFDIIVGADIIYEPMHCAWIYGAVQRLLAPGGVFHLIMPQRITHEVETAMARDMFRSADASEGEGKVLRVTRYMETERHAGKGRADEVRYMIWRMEWV